MWKNKRNWLLAGLLALCSIGAQAGEGAGVTILLRSGKSVSFTFAQRPKMNMVSEGLKIEVEGTDDLSLAFDEVQKVYFEDDVTTPVREVADTHKENTQSKVVFRCQSGTISATGLAAGDVVTVYSLNGQKAAQAVAGSDGALSLPIQQLTAGTYVVKSQSGIGYKIIKK